MQPPLEGLIGCFFTNVTIRKQDFGVNDYTIAKKSSTFASVITAQ